jgi:hypothetical protein
MGQISNVNQFSVPALLDQILKGIVNLPSISLGQIVRAKIIKKHINEFNLSVLKCTPHQIE